MQVADGFRPRASSRFEGFGVGLGANGVRVELTAGASTSATIALAAVTAFAAHALRSRVIRCDLFTFSS